MATFLSRLGLAQAELGAGSDPVDAVVSGDQTDEMAPFNGLIAVDVHTDDVSDYSVSEPGWYAVEDAGKVVLGPFTSLDECDRAIRDRSQHTVPQIPN
jgi:hypothetical protein